MGYIDNNLMNGESIVYRTKLHWVVFLWPMIWLAASIIFLRSNDDAAAIGGFFLLLAVITGFLSFINLKTSEFGITNKRLLVKVGFIRRNSLEVLLSKVESIQVKQGILGRILGFGTIIISGSGGTKNPFHKIVAPLEFRKVAQTQIDLAQDSK